MRNIFLIIVVLLVAFLIVHGNLDITTRQDVASNLEENYKEICGTVKKGETFFDIFKGQKTYGNYIPIFCTSRKKQ